MKVILGIVAVILSQIPFYLMTTAVPVTLLRELPVVFTETPSCSRSVDATSGVEIVRISGAAGRIECVSEPLAIGRGYAEFAIRGSSGDSPRTSANIRLQSENGAILAYARLPAQGDDDFRIATSLFYSGEFPVRVVLVAEHSPDTTLDFVPSIRMYHGGMRALERQHQLAADPIVSKLIVALAALSVTLILAELGSVSFSVVAISLPLLIAGFQFKPHIGYLWSDWLLHEKSSLFGYLFQVQASLFGNYIAGYSVLSILVLIASALLLHRVVEQASNSRSIAGVGVGLFALSCVHTPAIQWASGQQSLLSLLVLMLAIASSQSYQRSGNAAALSSVVLLSVLGPLLDARTIVLPILIWAFGMRLDARLRTLVIASSASVLTTGFAVGLTPPSSSLWSSYSLFAAWIGLDAAGDYAAICGVGLLLALVVYAARRSRVLLRISAGCVLAGVVTEALLSSDVAIDPTNGLTLSGQQLVLLGASLVVAAWVSSVPRTFAVVGIFLYAALQLNGIKNSYPFDLAGLRTSIYQTQIERNPAQSPVLFLPRVDNHLELSPSSLDQSN